MYTSDSVAALAAALAKAQGSITAASKDSTNPFFKSKYASLAAVWEAARQPLSVNGLAIVQTTEATENGLVLCTALIHASGEWIHSFYPIRPKEETPQAYGSALTYARRYALSAMLGVVADDDDDGNAGSNGKDKPQPAVEPVPLISEGQRKRLNQLGAQIYGTKQWDAKRHELVQAITKGRTDTSTELTQVEADKLIKGLEDKADKLKISAEPAPTDGTQESMLQEAAAANEHSSWGGQAL